MSIQISNINKCFDNFVALDNINLTIPDGELVALLGPSGSGKTTLLRIIAGLEEADSGTIYFNGEDTTATHVRDRGVGFVFQHYALFRHMSVFENVAFGLRVRPKATRPSEEEINERVHKLLKLIQLDWIANRYPSQLSGGQRQRVALARALAVEPKVLLLDEPFGALDAKVRQELRQWLRNLHDEIHITSVFVTHDQEEALEVSDKIVVMNQGKIEQIGTPEEVYDRPANPFVYSFLGNVNLFHARVEQGSLHLENTELHTQDLGNSKEASLFVRPHEINISVDNAEGSGIEAKLIGWRLVGPRVRVELETVHGHQKVEAEISKGEWQTIKAHENGTLFVHFSNARIYTNEASWNDYII